MSINEEIKNLQDDRDSIRTALSEMGVTEVSDHNFADFASDIKKISTGIKTHIEICTSSAANKVIELYRWRQNTGSFAFEKANFHYINISPKFEIGTIMVYRIDDVVFTNCSYQSNFSFVGYKLYNMVIGNGNAMGVRVGTGANELNLTSETIQLPVPDIEQQYVVITMEKIPE